jgi:hypothetical protein
LLALDNNLLSILRLKLQFLYFLLSRRLCFHRNLDPLHCLICLLLLYSQDLLLRVCLSTKFINRVFGVREFLQTLDQML